MFKPIVCALLGFTALHAAGAEPPRYDAAWILPQFVEQPIIFSIGGLNERGELVGSRGTKGGYSLPFGWSPTRGYRVGYDFGGGDRWAGAGDINDSGLAVGTGSTAQGFQAALFTRDGNMRDLGVLFPLGTSSSGSAINNAGLVAGNWSSPTGPAPFYWSKKDGLKLLEPVTGADQLSTEDMNASGTITGWYCTPTACGGFLGQPDGTLQTIPGIPRAINDAGNVVGEGERYGAAFIWNEASGYRLLPLTIGSGICFAYDINNAGVIVGFCDGPNGGAVAWYPQEAGYIARPLAELIDAMPQPMPPCGGELCFYNVTANAINDRGQIAVRVGAYPYGYIEDADIMLLTPRP